VNVSTEPLEESVDDSMSATCTVGPKALFGDKSVTGKESVTPSTANSMNWTEKLTLQAMEAEKAGAKTAAKAARNWKEKLAMQKDMEERNREHQQQKEAEAAEKAAEKAAKKWAEKLALQEAVEARNREYRQQKEAEKVAAKAEKAAAKAAAKVEKAAEKAAAKVEKAEKAAEKAAAKAAAKVEKAAAAAKAKVVRAKMQEYAERLVNELLPAKLREVELSQEQDDKVMQLLRRENIRQGIVTLILNKISDALSTNVLVEEFTGMQETVEAEVDEHLNLIAEH
jgi:hypothetical protein